MTEENHIWYAHYWINRIEKKLGFESSQDAYRFLESGGRRHELFVEGIILPDGTEVIHPFLYEGDRWQQTEHQKRWEALGQDPIRLTTTLVEKGHAFFNDNEGHIDYQELGEYHDGPRCARCGEQRCMHCHPDLLTERCPEYGNTLIEID